jgi:hypothetical protein
LSFSLDYESLMYETFNFSFLTLHFQFYLSSRIYFSIMSKNLINFWFLIFDFWLLLAIENRKSKIENRPVIIKESNLKTTYTYYIMYRCCPRIIVKIFVFLLFLLHNPKGFFPIQKEKLKICISKNHFFWRHKDTAFF